MEGENKDPKHVQETVQDTRNYLGLNLTTDYARLEIRKSFTLSNTSDQAKTLGIQHPAKQYQEQVGAQNQDLVTVFSGDILPLMGGYRVETNFPLSRKFAKNDGEVIRQSPEKQPSH